MSMHNDSDVWVDPITNNPRMYHKINSFSEDAWHIRGDMFYSEKRDCLNIFKHQVYTFPTFHNLTSLPHSVIET